MRKGVSIIFVLILGLGFSGSLFANDLDSSAQRGVALKLNIVNAGMVFQPNFTLGGEFLLGENNTFGIEPSVGYIFYSTEENVRANGLRLAQTFNSYFRQSTAFNLGVSFTGFYHHVKLESPLMVARTSGTFRYNEYADIKYTKTRIGGSVDFLFQPKLGDAWTIDMLLGLRITQHNTIVPGEVIQEDFPNSIFYGKNLLLPGFNFGVKLGYRLF